MVYQHEQNPQMTIHIRTSDDTEMAFTNVAPHSVEELKQRYPTLQQAMEETFGTDKHGKLKTPKGSSFIESTFS
jgi:hypothetical protein